MPTEPGKNTASLREPDSAKVMRKTDEITARQLEISLRERIKKIFDYSEEDGLHINEILELIAEERQAAKRELGEGIKEANTAKLTYHDDTVVETELYDGLNKLVERLIEGKGEDA